MILSWLGIIDMELLDNLAFVTTDVRSSVIRFYDITSKSVKDMFF